MTRHAAANRQDGNPLDPAAFSIGPERRKAEAGKAAVPRRVIVVGAGFISHVHAEILRGCPDIRIAAVVDPAAEAAQGFARRWGVECVFSTVDEALAKIDFDCAHVAVPPGLRASQVEPRVPAAVDRLAEIARARGQTLVQLALAWVLRRPEVTSTLIGVRNLDQLKENLGVLGNFALSADELAAIDDATRDGQINLFPTPKSWLS